MYSIKFLIQTQIVLFLGLDPDQDPEQKLTFFGGKTSGYKLRFYSIYTTLHMFI